MDKLIEKLAALFPDKDVMMIMDEDENYVQLRGERMILQVYPTPEVSFHIAMRPDRSAKFALEISKITEQEIKISQSFWSSDGENYVTGDEAGHKLIKHILGKVKMHQLYDYLMDNGNEGIQH